MVVSTQKRKFEVVVAEAEGHGVWLKNGVGAKCLKLSDNKVRVDGGASHGYYHSYPHAELNEDCLNINFANCGISTEFA